jgi:hypothetical protein
MAVTTAVAGEEGELDFRRRQANDDAQLGRVEIRNLTLQGTFGGKMQERGSGAI